MFNKCKKNPGFVALISVILVAAVVLIYALSLSHSNILSMQATTAKNLSTEVFHLANTCMEEALMRLRRDSSYTGSVLNLTEGTCTISIVAVSDNRVITVGANQGDYYQSLEMDVDLQVVDSSHNFVFNYWKEK